MPNKHNINGIHAQRLKDIRPFINFNYDLRKPLTKYQKRRIKQYWDEIDKLTARPYQIYRPRSKVHLKKAQIFAQHEKNLPGLKVAFIPVSNPNKKTKIRFTKKGELIAETEHVRTRFLEFDMFELINDPVGHAQELVDGDPFGKAFSILAGQFEIPAAYSRNLVAEQVGKYALKYSNEEANNYFGNWMNGLNSHHFKNQASFMDYQAEKSKAKKRLQRERKNRKRRKDK